MGPKGLGGGGGLEPPPPDLPHRNQPRPPLPPPRPPPPRPPPPRPPLAAHNKGRSRQMKKSGCISGLA